MKWRPPPGRDGNNMGEEYEVGSFARTDHDQGIVWADGFSVRYPCRTTD